MFGTHFYNETIKRCVSVFGTLFNNIDVKKIFELIDKYNVTHFGGAPIVLNMITGASEKDRKKYKKLVVLCKGNSVTGGSELVHQLCHELNSLSLDSSIAYYPLDEKYSIPEEYSIYDVKLSKLDDEHENIIMLPEVATKFAYKIKLSLIHI